MTSLAGVARIPGVVGVGTLTGGPTLMILRENIQPTDLADEENFDTSRNNNPNLVVSVEIIIISALIFIAILIWFEFLRVWYDNVFGNDGDFAIVWYRLVYAIFITALVLILLYVVYRIFNPCNPLRL